MNGNLDKERVCHIREFYWFILPSERAPDCAIPMTWPR